MGKPSDEDSIFENITTFDDSDGGISRKQQRLAIQAAYDRDKAAGLISE